MTEALEVLRIAEAGSDTSALAHHEAKKGRDPMFDATQWFFVAFFLVFFLLCIAFFRPLAELLLSDSSIVWPFGLRTKAKGGQVKRSKNAKRSKA